MNGLVIGGTGFLGRSIANKLLQNGHSVRVLSRQQSHSLPDSRVQFHRGDVRDFQSVANACVNIDFVIHSAAKVGVCGPASEYEATNLHGTENVIRACRENGVRSLVYTSSPSVIFSGQDENGVNEDAPYPRRFLNPYSRTKALAEQAVLQSNSNSFRTCALRPHFIWGPGDRFLIPAMVESARRNRLFIIGDGQNRVDLTYVENAAYAHVLAIDALQKGKAAGKAYFVSDDGPVKLWEWIRTFLSRLGINKPVRRISAATAYTIGAVLESCNRVCGFPKVPALTRLMALGLSRSHYFDISRVKRDLNYTPVLSNEEALKSTIEHFSMRAHIK